MNTLSPFSLGATLYMPATRHDIVDVVLNNKIPGLRSLVICLEDAVSEIDVPLALRNLHPITDRLASAGYHSAQPVVFIRPRDADMGDYLTQHYNLKGIAGLVLPKFTHASLERWVTILNGSHLYWMPTLETEEVFDVVQMRELALALSEHACRDRILALRIGGNDLMNILALRRSRDSTLYDGPMGYVIKMLVSVFGARNFSLTAPVCELIDNASMLEQELRQDIEHGMVGKTAIHPCQIALIHQALMVSQTDHQDALRIMNSNQAVFKHNGAMCEPATHKRWANSIMIRSQFFGVSPSVGQASGKSLLLGSNQ